jgi:DNA (cytosine-5)-methyltransferase 1
MEKVTVGEAARKLELSEDTIRRWAKLGLLRYEKDARGVRLFDVGEIDRVSRQRSSPSQRPRKRFKVLKSRMNGFTSVELFAGAGGTALGMHNAGFKHLLLNEVNHDACETLRINRPRWKVQEGDVHSIDFSQYLGRVDLLQGGVPCQAFSYAGKSKGFEDARGTLFFEFARAVSEIQPKILMMENVRGLLTHDHGHTIHTMLRILDNLGYKVGLRILRAQFFDVAQKRERLVIIGVRDDLEIPILFPREKDYTLTLREVLDDCPASEGEQYSKKKADVLRLVPPGGYWKDLPQEICKEYMGKSYFLTGGKTGMARRLSWDEPSLTLTCSPAQKQTERCHPEETRPLTVREYARIQSFPDVWSFAGSVSSQYRQIGNAVPVNLAFHIGKAIEGMLSGEETNDCREVDPIKLHAQLDSSELDELKKKALSLV